METTTMKVWKQTLDNLKVLAAYQKSTMLATLDRLIKAELELEEKRRNHSSGQEKTEQ